MDRCVISGGNFQGGNINRCKILQTVFIDAMRITVPILEVISVIATCKQNVNTEGSSIDTAPKSFKANDDCRAITFSFREAVSSGCQVRSDAGGVSRL